MSALPFALRLTCCCWLTYFFLLNLTSNALPERHHHQSNPRRYLDEDARAPALASLIENVDIFIDEDDDDDDEIIPDDLDDDFIDVNATAEKGKFLGSPCESSCNPLLQHVFCNPEKGLCECEKLYPVRLGPTKGCAKPKNLGEQCFYRVTCTFADQHSTCTQVQHNAVCDCEEGYHRASLSRPGKKVFCAKDLVLITTDLPTFLAIISGIAVLTGLICFVLKLFSRTRYTTPRHFANASHVTPMLFSRDTGIPLTIHGRPSSRSSQRSSGGTLTCAFSRRPSSGGSRGPLVPTSRAGAARAAAILLISCHRQGIKGGNKHRRTLSDVAEGSTDGLGSRRPSVASIHSSTSSARSFSAKRLERERNEKEQRQALQELKLAKQRERETQQAAPTPSPRTPHSTDELLPAVEEGKETYYEQQEPGVLDTVESSGITKTSIALTNEITPVVTTPLFDKDIISCSSADVFKS